MVKKNRNHLAQWQINRQRLKQWNRMQLNIIRTQPLDAQSQVNSVDAKYQKLRAELHEARKTIPPKNPVDADKLLAASRGEFVEGISDRMIRNGLRESRPAILCTRISQKRNRTTRKRNRTAQIRNKTSQKRNNLNQ